MGRQFNPPVRAPAPGAAAPSPEKAAEAETPQGSNLWLTLSQLPRPRRNVPFPRKIPGTNEDVGEVAIWPLTHAELLESNAQADQHVQTLFKVKDRDALNLGHTNSFATELAVQHLWRACRDPDNVENAAFPSPKVMRHTLTGDEIGVLYNHYLTIQSELGPITSTLSEEEYEALVRRIAEHGNADPFDSLSWDLQRTTVVSMAAQLASFWTATISAGSPPEESTSSASSGESGNGEQVASED